MPKPRKFAVRRKKGMDISRMKTVLVAEDEASIRDFIVINLQRSGYEVLEAGDGLEALHIYDERNGEVMWHCWIL